MATKADLLALVAELQDGDTVNFKAVGRHSRWDGCRFRGGD
jgi:hypothetical protein